MSMESLKNICNICEKHFQSKSTLNRHLKTVHKVSIEITSKVPHLCPIKDCSYASASTADVKTHLCVAHKYELDEVERTFDSIQDFSKWKDEFEKSNKVFFKKCRSDAKCKDFIKQYFICNRSGIYVSRSEGKRCARSTSKSGKICPAYLNATICNTSAKVSVLYMNTHLGHSHELKYLRLPESHRIHIANQIKSGVSKDKILDFVRSSIDDNYNRGHLLMRKDLNNIEASFGLKEIERHSDDATSVHLMYTEYNELDNENPFIICKLQGEKVGLNGISDDDVFIVIMNPLQEAMLKKFGKHLICIDSTHGTNGYHFILTTVMIVDEFGEGFPVAWLISSHETEIVLNHFFGMIKTKIGDNLETEWFMSDDAEQFYSAWASVFEHKPKKLLCTWHVDRAWCQKLNIIVDPSRKAETYGKLCLLRHEIDEVKFRKMICEFKEDLKENEEMEQFFKYFETYYAKRTEQWAVCFRKGAFINTNMYLESFHKVLKHIYLKGKVNKRLDRCIYMLFNLLRNKSVERLIKLEKGKVSKRISEINKRHKTSLGMDESSVVYLSDTTFKIINEESLDYVVQIDGIECSQKCHLKCLECDVCIHTSRCTCPDYTLRGIICKHIHLTARVNYSKKYSVCQDDNVNKQNNMELDSTIPVILNSLGNQENIEEISIVEKRRKTETFLNTIYSNIQNCDNMALVDEVNSRLSKICNLMQLDCKHSKDIALPTTSNEPANKSVTLIRKFKSKRVPKLKTKASKLKPYEMKKIKKDWIGEHAGRPTDVKDPHIEDHNYCTQIATYN